MNEHVVFIRNFHVYVPCRPRTRRTCCLRLTPPRGARLSTPKDPSCQTSPRATDSPSFASGQIHPAAASIAALVRGSPSIYHPRPSSSRGGRREVFRFPSRPASRNAFNLNRLGVWRKGWIFRFLPIRPRRPPFGRQPCKLSASTSPVNPCPPTCGDPVTAWLRRGA